METLILPEPAATFWTAVRGPLRDAFAAERTTAGLILTGGTVLAARLRHRESNDIDIKLPSLNDLVAYAPDRPRGRELDARLAPLGARRLKTLATQIIYELARQGLDLSSGNLWPSPIPLAARIAGEDTYVASNSQILSGKIFGRGTTAPTRDLFDLGVCHYLDRSGAAAAINTLTQRGFDEVLAAWETTRPRHQAQATDFIRGSPETLTPMLADPAGAATEAVKELTYRLIAFNYDREGCTITARRFGPEGRLGATITSGSALLRACMELGIYQSPQSILTDTEPLVAQLTESVTNGTTKRLEVKTVTFEGDPQRAREHREAATLRHRINDYETTERGEAHILITASHVDIAWKPLRGAPRRLARTKSPEEALKLLDRAGIEPPDTRPERLLEMSLEQVRAREMERTLNKV